MMFVFLSDKRPMLKTLDFAFYIGSTPTFYISICISTLPTQHTTFISLFATKYTCTTDYSDDLVV